MASPIVRGQNFSSTELVNATKLQNIVDNSTFKGTDGNGVSFSASSGGDLGACVAAGGLEVHSTGQLQIKNNGVTLAKMATQADQTVLGNVSGGTAVPTAVPIVGASGVLKNDDALGTSDTQGATQGNIRAFVLAISNQYFHLQETESSGNNSTTTLAGNSYTKRPVASVSNNIASASVSTGVITLPAGTYEVKAFGLCRGDGNGTSPNRTRFRNTSDSSTVILGVSVSSIGQSGVDNQCQPLAYLHGTFTIAGSKNFELQHYKDGSTSVLGGEAVSSGENEVYADVLIKKLD